MPQAFQITGEILWFFGFFFALCTRLIDLVPARLSKAVGRWWKGIFGRKYFASRRNLILARRRLFVGL